MPFKDPNKRRAYQREYHKRYYLDNAEKYKKKAKRWNKSQRKWAREFISRVKSFSQCVDCGQSDSRVLDFDHVHGEKIGNVSDMVNGSYSIGAIKKEIRKCEVRCSNCHRIKTIERRDNENEEAGDQAREKED
jgi:hypothetical protein